MKKLNLLILFVLIAYPLAAYAGEARESKVPSSGSPEKAVGCYKVSKSYPLTKAIHGIDGVLQLLQDARLTKDLYNNKQFGSTFNGKHMDDKETLRLFKDNPPLGGVLRVLSQHKGSVLTEESHTFDDTPIAWLEEDRRLGLRPIYLLTRDFSTGVGSYNGPVTFFYEIVDGKLHPIEYFNNETKKREQIALMRSLKTNWKVVKTKDGKTKDILFIACRPNFEHKSKDETEFLIYYDRFHFDGKEWFKFEKVEKGYWEVEGEALPDPSKFPTACR